MCLAVSVDSPLYIRAHSKTVLTLAITNDTSFLSSHLVMDYSLLVGFDETNKQLVIGIIGQPRSCWGCIESRKRIMLLLCEPEPRKSSNRENRCARLGRYIVDSCSFCDTDYIRTFTWDKKLEMVFKTTYNTLGGQGGA